MSHVTLLLILSTIMFGQATRTEGNRGPDTWQKMMDCAAQAERIKTVVLELALGMEREGPATDREDPDLAYSISRLDGEALARWEATHDSHTANHFSPKYDRCYVRISLTVEKAGRVSAQSIRLVDAFELVTVARFRATAPASKNLCLAGDRVVGCEAAKDYISEHMRN